MSVAGCSRSRREPTAAIVFTILQRSRLCVSTRKAQSLGFSLAEIKRILNMRGLGAERCRCVIAMAEATLSETEKKLSDLRQFADLMRENLARWRTTPLRAHNLAGEFCRLIETSPTASN
jgi:DNA-binding transcriptional MerR regulator